MTHNNEKKTFETEALRIRDVIGGQTLQPVEEENQEFEEKIRKEDSITVVGVGRLTKREDTNQDPTITPEEDVFRCEISKHEGRKGKHIECTQKRKTDRDSKWENGLTNQLSEAYDRGR